MEDCKRDTNSTTNQSKAKSENKYLNSLSTFEFSLIEDFSAKVSFEYSSNGKVIDKDP